jgi:hypothetical protein
MNILLWHHNVFHILTTYILAKSENPEKIADFEEAATAPSCIAVIVRVR